MISKISKWFRSWRLSLASSSHNSESIQKIVHDNSLGKRLNSRVSYSHIGAVGELPRIFFNGDEMNVGNVSVGGALIIDDGGLLGTTVGEIIQLEFRWKDMSVKIRSRVVGANLQRRHIQFVDSHQALKNRLERAVELGHPGTKFHRVQLATKKIEASEIWMDAAGGNLVFRDQDHGRFFAELSFNNRIMSFDSHAWPQIQASGEETREMSLAEISATLLVLANFRDASPNVHFLIERLHHFYERPPRAQAG